MYFWIRILGLYLFVFWEITCILCSLLLYFLTLGLLMFYYEMCLPYSRPSDCVRRPSSLRTGHSVGWPWRRSVGSCRPPRYWWRSCCHHWPGPAGSRYSMTRWWSVACASPGSAPSCHTSKQNTSKHCVWISFLTRHTVISSLAI